VKPGLTNASAETFTELWKLVLTMMVEEEKVTEQAVDLWLKDCKIIQIQDDEILIYCEDEWKCGIIERTYFEELSSVIKKLLKEDLTPRLISKKDNVDIAGRNVKTERNFARDKYSFDNFIVGATNRLAYSAAKSVAEEKSGAYNPLFIYGNPGLGKTHLLFAIAHEVKIRNSALKIVYIKAENFMNEFIEAIQSKRYERNNEFRKKYREADILLVDDIQAITNGDRVQDEFFHTYEALFDSGKPIVLTSDRPPREMLKLEQRLHSRFTSGLMVMIEPPDLETRMAVVITKAKEHDMKLSDDVVKLIADNITQNVRMIEGVVNKIHAYSQLEESNTIDVDTVKKILSDMVIEQKRATPEQVIERVGKYYNIPIDKITGDGRDKPVALARQVSIYLIREITGLTYDDIGKSFGNKDHTTIIHARKKIEREIETNPELADVIRNIITDIEESNQISD